MTKYLKNIAVFSAVVLCLFVVIELLLLSQPNKYSFKRGYVEAHTHTIKTLLLGNSHVEYSINPAFLGHGAFNLATEGRPVEYDVALAERYVPVLDSLEAIVLQLDYEDFVLGRGTEQDAASQQEDDFTSTYKCMYYKYMGLRIDPFWYWSEILNSRLNYMYRFVGGKWNAVRCDSLGYQNLKLINRKDGWKERKMPELVDDKIPIDSTQLRNFSQQITSIAEIAKKHGVRLFLITTPVHSSSRHRINKRVKQDMADFVCTLKQRFDNVSYLDFTDCDELDDNDYWDATHLTETGATKFSKLLHDHIR